MKNSVAILLLGGEGRRFKEEGKPKQFQPLSGKKVYLHTLERFLSVRVFSEILLVAHPDYLQEVEADLLGVKGARVVQGGKTRQHSSYAGLLACPAGTEYVVIHDAVRPFVSRSILLENIEKVRQYGAVDTCIPSADTLVVAEGGKVASIPERARYLRGQTPQSFRYDLILRAHENALKKNLEGISDDCRLVMEEGHSVVVVQGDENNIKITTQLDLFLAEQLIRLQRHTIDGSTNSLLNKQYVVVGGTGGIGRAICEELLQEGAKVVPLSRTSPHYSVDIRDWQSVEQALDQIGPIDGLINSAGLLRVKELKALSMEEIQELLNVNLLGVVYACKSAKIVPGGHIVNIASSSFTRGRKHYAIYSSAKAGVVNFTQALAEERPELNINTVVPQRTHTEMRTANFPKEDLHHLLSPQSVAKTVVDLLKQSDLTGHIIEVRKK